MKIDESSRSTALNRHPNPLKHIHEFSKADMPMAMKVRNDSLLPRRGGEVDRKYPPAWFQHSAHL